uniref:Uncharacterized protein n=1 Tax=Paracidobacterium acidisoli TaxID=2303751 RepID=A0A372ILS1_9BACT
MDTANLIPELNKEIARLREARNLLAGTSSPKGAKASKKRTLSAEARARIAAAQKKRWAKARKNAA